MTRFIFAYDTERGESEIVGGTRLPACIEGAERLVEIHHRNKIPATFFIVGETLESDPRGYRRLLDDPLFEVGTHTYSHKLILHHGIWGPPAPPEEVREEIFRGKDIVEQVFGRPCRGLRPGCGFLEQNLKSSPSVLGMLGEAGLEYVSTVLWGPDFTLPAPLLQSFTYRDAGFPGLREFPSHGWHDNVLRGQLRVWGIDHLRLLSFPPILAKAVPCDAVKTPEEEFAIYRYLIEKALEEKLEYVSFIMHPWSLFLFDKKMKIIEMTMRFVRERGMEICTFGELNDRLNSAVK